MTGKVLKTPFKIIVEMGGEQRVIVDYDPEKEETEISSVTWTHIPTFITINPETGLTALISETYEVEVTYKEPIIL